MADLTAKHDRYRPIAACRFFFKISETCNFFKESVITLKIITLSLRTNHQNELGVIPNKGTYIENYVLIPLFGYENSYLVCLFWFTAIETVRLLKPNYPCAFSSKPAMGQNCLSVGNSTLHSCSPDEASQLFCDHHLTILRDPDSKTGV